MNNKFSMVVKMPGYVAGGLVSMAHLAYAQSIPPDAPAMMSVPAPVPVPTPVPVPAPVSVAPIPSESAAPKTMLHRWRRVASWGRGEKSLDQLIAERPDLQTHSHMTYYYAPFQVGERARLQPPGSEFKH